MESDQPAALMTMVKPMVDPNCLCGKPHPCPVHGRWASGNGYKPPDQLADEFDPILLLDLVMDADRVDEKAG